MPPNPRQQPTSSSRRVSGSSSGQSDHRSESDGLDLKTDVERFLGEADNKRTALGRKKKLKKLMRRISSQLPKDQGSSGLNQEDRDLCLDVIRLYIQKRNRTVLGFVALIEAKSFAHLHLHICTCSELTIKDKIVNPENLIVHGPCDAEILSSHLKSIMTIEPLKFPTAKHYDVVKWLLGTFNLFFDQSSEQSAVIKVAAYSALLYALNEHMCTKYFSEFTLFSVTRQESAAEVVAHVDGNGYRYFLTGRADAFIVSLTAETKAGLSILADERVQERFSEICEDVKLINVFPGRLINIDEGDELAAPKYQLLADELQEFVDSLNKSQRARVSYEIIVLEVKKLQPEAKIEGTELIDHLKQVIGECAAIHEYGPDQCRFLKFILSDGNRWLFGVLRNPEINAVGFDTRRECFYIVFDNSGLDLVEKIVEMLAGWMAIPGNTLYSSLLATKKE